jgi:hypothetical protein
VREAIRTEHDRRIGKVETEVIVQVRDKQEPAAGPIRRASAE